MGHLLKARLQNVVFVGWNVMGVLKFNEISNDMTEPEIGLACLTR
jgi:hypothetical protein